MRTTFVLLAIAVLAVVVLAQCRPQESQADSAASDTAGGDDTAATSRNQSDRAQAPLSAARTDTPRTSRPIRRAADAATDSLPPDDSIRAMRPEMPQVTPPKRPRTWRGFKLPEEMPVRAPVETIKQVEQVPDSVMKGDSISRRPPAR